MPKRKTHEEFISQMLDMHPTIKVLERYEKSNVKILCECAKCGKRWHTTPNVLLDRHGCPHCAGVAKKTNEAFVSELSVANPLVRPVGKYENSCKKIECECAVCYNHWFATPTNLLGGSKCPECFGTPKLTNEEFIERLKDVHPHIRPLEQYVTANTKILFRCDLDDYVWQSTPSNVMYKGGCPRCSKRETKTPERFREIMRDKNPDIEVVGDYKKNNIKLLCHCLKCNEEWNVTPNSLLNGSGCPHCSVSRGERKIKNWLRDQNIEYKFQHTFSDCKNIFALPFDFYIPSLRCVIEYDGEQHYMPVKFGGANDRMAEFRYQQTVERDKIKTNYCKDHGIKLIRIPYTEYDRIEKILDVHFA